VAQEDNSGTNPISVLLTLLGEQLLAGRAVPDLHLWWVRAGESYSKAGVAR
jgi:hypothetical protein